MLTDAPFDAVAHRYDEEFTNSVIGRLQRDKVWKLMEGEIKKETPLHILELNCGTGEDAVWLAQKGHYVTATDISNKMLEVAEQKINSQEHINSRIKCVQCSFHSLTEKFRTESFDLIFSNFGGLNCANEAELKKLNNDCAALLKPGGKLIVVLMAKYCLLEQLYFYARNEREKIHRRRKPAMAALGNNAMQQTYYYETSEFEKRFPDFKLKKKKPVGLFIPPSYMESWIRKNKWAVNLIVFMEKIAGNISRFADYGDHAYLVLERK